MSKAPDLQISTSLHEKVQYALDYGLNALSAADPLVPFAVSWRNDGTTIERYMQGAYDDSIEMAMRNINEADETVTAYAVVWSGFVEVEDKKLDAIIVEAGERMSTAAVQLALPYQQLGDEVSQSLELMALGSAPNLLLSKLNAFTIASHLVKPAYVSTEGFKFDVASQPYAQMPAAIICLAANLTTGEEANRLTSGIRKLQELEAKEGAAALSHRVFSVVTSMVADGDFSTILKTEDIGELAGIVVEGAAQLKLAVQKGLVGQDHAAQYYADLGALLKAVLTDNGKAQAPQGSEKIEGLLLKAQAA